MAESTYLEDLETGKVSKHCRFFKMKVLKAQDSDAIDEEVKKSIDQETIVFSDKNNSYLRIEDYVNLCKNSPELLITFPGYFTENQCFFVTLLKFKSTYHATQTRRKREPGFHVLP